MKQSICPQCQSGLDCGPVKDQKNCWCNELPAILAPDPAKGCLCKACLIKATATQIAHATKTRSHREMLELAKPYCDQKPLLQGLDYTMEGGNLVFSSWYHLKRGSCCGNGCRHCPYPR